MGWANLGKTICVIESGVQAPFQPKRLKGTHPAGLSLSMGLSFHGLGSRPSAHLLKKSEGMGEIRELTLLKLSSVSIR